MSVSHWHGFGQSCQVPKSIKNLDFFRYNDEIFTQQYALRTSVEVDALTGFVQTSERVISPGIWSDNPNSSVGVDPSAVCVCVTLFNLDVSHPHYCVCLATA